jgi:hypothetical protein
MYVPFGVFCVLFVCNCVLYYCHWVSTQLHLNICFMKFELEYRLDICRATVPTLKCTDVDKNLFELLCTLLKT